MVDDERVTLRLPRYDLGLLDTLVEAGVFGSRSEAIRQAIRELINGRAKAVAEALDARRKLAESAAALHNLKAALETEREQRIADSETPLGKLERR